MSVQKRSHKDSVPGWQKMKGKKVFYRNKLLGLNSEINIPKTKPHFSSETEITDALQKED